MSDQPDQPTAMNFRTPFPAPLRRVLIDLDTGSDHWGIRAMENPNAGGGHGQEGRLRSGLLSISLTANVVLAIAAVGLGIWGWSRHERTKDLNKMVVAADEKVAAAVQERDEAWENSRELQGRLVNAKGLMNAMSEPFQQPPRSQDDDDAAPP